MSTRLTVNQVANECLSLASGLCDHEGPSYVTSLGYVEAMQDAARLIRLHLVPRWQDEPDADGWYWVQGYVCPRFVSSETGWKHSSNEYGSDQFNLNNRRVCPIGERPEDGA